MIDALIGAAVEVATDWDVDRPKASEHAQIIEWAARIPARWSRFAHCVSERESGGSYTARNASSSAAGRWQFLDVSWRINGGLHFMVVKRLKAFGLKPGPAADVRQFLKRTPIDQWPGPYQDTAFLAVIEVGGWHHWRGVNCNHLAP